MINVELQDRLSNVAETLVANGMSFQQKHKLFSISLKVKSFEDLPEEFKNAILEAEKPKVEKYGTTEGALLGWDTRGRGQKTDEKPAETISRIVSPGYVNRRLAVNTSVADLPKSQRTAIYKHLEDMGVKYEKAPGETKEAAIHRSMTNRAIEAIKDVVNKGQENIGLDWYSRVGLVCNTIARETKTHPEQFKAVVAVLSANNTWSKHIGNTEVFTNLEIATTVCDLHSKNPVVKISQADVDRWKEGETWPKDFGKTQLDQYVGKENTLDKFPPEVVGLIIRDSIQINPEFANARAGLKNWQTVSKAEKILRADNIGDIDKIVSGQKTRSFFDNLNGYQNDPTIDRHMVRFLAGVDDINTAKAKEFPRAIIKNDPESKWVKEVGSYPAFADAIRDTTLIANEENLFGRLVSPADIQAIIWYKQIELTHKVKKYGTSEGALLGWDHRGRGRKEPETGVHPIEIHEDPEDIINAVLRSNSINMELDRLDKDMDETIEILGLDKISPETIKLNLERRLELMHKKGKLVVEKAELGRTVTGYCNQEFKSITPNANVDLYGVDASFALDVTKNARILKDEYPQYMDKLKRIGLGPASGGWAAYAESENSIELSEYSFTPSKADQFYRELRESVESGWHPPGCDTPESVFTHEFGHHVYYTDLKEVKNMSIEDMWKPEYQVVNKITTLLYGELADHPVSEYAKKSLSERWAESFMSVYHTPPEKQTEGVKQLGQLLRSPEWKNRKRKEISEES